MTYPWYDMLFFFLAYSLLGWAAEAAFYGVTNRVFQNRGILTLPFLPSYGVTFCLMLWILPTLDGYRILQFLMTMVLAEVVERLSDFLLRRVNRNVEWADRKRLFEGSVKGLGLSLIVAGALYLIYLLVQPLLITLTLLIPKLLLEIAMPVLLGILILDGIASVYGLRRAAGPEVHRTNPFAARLSAHIWNRLQKAYPGVREMEPEEQAASYVFAEGLCFDKLIWVFFLCALLGDLIETLYCRLVGGSWMSRSSVLYGPFSFVWGIGAVVLTITLQRVAEKPDRHVFLAGFIVGGAYEYLCSVFTELAFGTVFWDYSDMPLNIGGRTNVLFCCFWGILAVVWVKLLYPRLSQLIERLPPVAGKAITWVVVAVMLCNALLTGAAMLRYSARQTQPEAANALEAFLDSQYPDDRMERRWPNMIIT